MIPCLFFCRGLVLEDCRDNQKGKLMKKRKSRNMVRTIILIASSLALLMAATVGYIGYSHIKKAYFSSFEEGLHAAAVLLKGDLSNQYTGDWKVTGDGTLLKGGVQVHDDFERQLDSWEIPDLLHLLLTSRQENVWKAQRLRTW